MEFEKLYTAEDVAQITGLTLRTIRNYIKDGRLKGCRIGVQWRFTAADIQALFDAPAPAAAEMAVTAEPEEMEPEPETMRLVREFIQRKKAPRFCACSIVDIPGVSEQDARFLYNRMQSLAAVYQDGPKRLELTYEYDEMREQARFVFSGAMEQACTMMNLCEVQ